MRIAKYVVVGLLVAAVGALAVDSCILHREVVRLHEQIKIERDNDPILKAVAELKVEVAGFAAELKSFERLTAEKDAELVKAVSGREFTIHCDLHAGDADYWVWTSDVSYEYVKINADYHT